MATGEECVNPPPDLITDEDHKRLSLVYKDIRFKHPVESTKAQITISPILCCFCNRVPIRCFQSTCMHVHVYCDICANVVNWKLKNICVKCSYKCEIKRDMDMERQVAHMNVSCPYLESNRCRKSMFLYQLPAHMVNCWREAKKHIKPLTLPTVSWPSFGQQTHKFQISNTTQEGEVIYYWKSFKIFECGMFATPTFSLPNLTLGLRMSKDQQESNFQYEPPAFRIVYTFTQPNELPKLKSEELSLEDIHDAGSEKEPAPIYVRAVELKFGDSVKTVSDGDSLQYEVNLPTCLFDKLAINDKVDVEVKLDFPHFHDIPFPTCTTGVLYWKVKSLEAMAREQSSQLVDVHRSEFFYTNSKGYRVQGELSLGSINRVVRIRILTGPFDKSLPPNPAFFIRLAIAEKEDQPPVFFHTSISYDFNTSIAFNPESKYANIPFNLVLVVQNER